MLQDKPFFFAAVLYFICVGSVLFAQLNVPSMPSVTAPLPPQLSVSTQSSAQGGTALQNSNTKNMTPAANSASKPNGVSAAAVSSLSASLQGALLGGQDGLLGGLLGNLPGNAQAVQQKTNAETTFILSQILAKLNELEQKQNNDGTNKTETDSFQGEPTRKSGRILRFTVNNYSVLDTCRTTYFSDKSKDGSFLLTADRIYLSDGKNRTETFYMLFKKTEPNVYEVATSVTQDYLNEYSFLHQLSRRPTIQASQTGNLITMRIKDPDWKLDLLIDAADMREYQ